MKRTPIRNVSKKRAAENRQRRKVVAQIAEERGALCVVPTCSRIADDPHEVLTRARGGSITDPANIVLICRPHHREITGDVNRPVPQWAYDLGLVRHSWDVAS